MDDKYIQELAETTARSRSNCHRIDELEKDVKENNQLAINVRELTVEIKHMREDYQKSEIRHTEEIERVSHRLAEVENKPVKRYEQVVGYILSGVISAIMGFFVARFTI